MKKNIIDTTKVLALAFVLSMGVFYAEAAWTTRPANPPDNNVDAPLNVGTSTQVKEGSLGIGAILSGSKLNVDGALSADSLSVFGNQYISGRLGIGTSTPTVSLDVIGNIKNSSLFMRQSGSNNYVIEHISDIGDLYLRAYESGDTSGNLVLNDLGGAVKVGETAFNETLIKLGVSGNVGAEKYCELDGTNCVDPDEFATSCPTGQVLQGFNSAGVKVCVTPSGSTGTKDYVIGGAGMTSSVSGSTTTLNIVATTGTNQGIIVGTNDIGIDYTKVQKILNTSCTAPNYIQSINPSTGAVTCSTPAGSGDVGGSGTTNTVPLWTAAKTLGNSVLKQSSDGLMAIGSILSGSKLNVDGALSADSLSVFGNGTFTSNLNVGDAIGGTGGTIYTRSQIELGSLGAGDRNSYIDFQSTDTDNDYSFRLLRSSGVNGAVELINKGTGVFRLNAFGAADMDFRTSNTSRMTIESTGTVGIGTTEPNDGLKLGVSGNVGASAYCDVNNANCVTPGELSARRSVSSFAVANDPADGTGVSAVSTTITIPMGQTAAVMVNADAHVDSNGSNTGSFTMFIYVDNVKKSEMKGLDRGDMRDGSDGERAVDHQPALSWAGDLGAGNHTIEIRANTSDNWDSSNFHLSVIGSW